MNDGTYAEPSKLPLAFYLRDEWLPAVRGQLRPLTVRKYESVIRSQVASRPIGAIPLRALSAAHFNGLYGEMERCADPDCGHDDGDCRGLSVASRRLVHAVLRRALADAVGWDKLRRNPAASADPPALPRTMVESWTGIGAAAVPRARRG